MFSGGIDSTFTLARLLKETGHEVHAHHIGLVNREGRAQFEALACHNIIEALGKIRPFTYTTSLVDHTGRQFLPYDMAIACFEAGVIARDFAMAKKKPFDKWTIGTHKDEGHWKERWAAISPAVRAACWPADCPDFELQPLVTKKRRNAIPQRFGHTKALLVLQNAARRKNLR